MSARLHVTILHELPGRLRVRLSHPLIDVTAYDAALKAHAGVAPIRYSPTIRTVLVTFDPDRIRREELLVRMAVAFALEHACAPVRIQHLASSGALTSAEALSAAALLAAGLARGLGLGNRSRLETTAGALTGGAVMAHGLRELHGAGVFHPELLSLAYLAAGMWRGRTLQAAAFTWFAAFGRHVMEVGEPAVEIQARHDGATPGVSVSAAPASPAQAFLRILPTLVRFMPQAAQPLDDMLANLREISQSHDHVLDALGPWKRGIPVQFTGAGG